MKIFNTIVSIFKKPESADIEIRTQTPINDNTLATITSYHIMEELSHGIADKISDKFVELHGEKIMAKLNRKAIANSTIAKISTKIAQELVRTSK